MTELEEAIARRDVVYREWNAVAIEANLLREKVIRLDDEIWRLERLREGGAVESLRKTTDRVLFRGKRRR